MYRILLAWMAVGLVAGVSGCVMCASPYDYCYPTFTGDCGSQCRVHGRVGSAFGGCGGCAHAAPGPEGLSPLPDAEISSAVIISETDEKVADVWEPDETIVEASQPTDPPSLLPAAKTQGWRAARSTRTSLR